MGETLPNDKGYCRRCAKILPIGEFYDCTDAGFVDTNMKLSVCKKCTNNIYDELFKETKSMEKSLHKMCIILNLRFSNEAVSATKAHIETLINSGKNVTSVFGIYKQKVLATQKSMDKNALADMTYEDIGTVYTTETKEIQEIPIPQDVVTFWGDEFNNAQIRFLQNEYTNFKQTHPTDSYAQITLLKRVCYTLLDIKEARKQGDSTDKLSRELRDLMTSLAIAPNNKSTKDQSLDSETFGVWIEDIERYEPAQWLQEDPRGDIYRDVADTEVYFTKYIVRPTKNFITQSRDFNVEESEQVEDYDPFEDEYTDFDNLKEG